LYVRIDRRRKMPATILFKAMGLTKTDILDYFYDHEEYIFDGERVLRKLSKDQYRKEDAFEDIVLSDGKVAVKKNRPVTKKAWRDMIKDGMEAMEVSPDTLLGQFLAQDIIDEATGEVTFEAATELSADIIETIRATGVKEIRVLFTRGMDVSSSMRDTLAADKTTDLATAQIEIYRRLRPSSPPTSEIAASFFENLFRSSDYYDLSTVGRYKLNTRLGINEPLELRTLTNEDILKSVKVLVKLKDSHGPADDIDHLGNRRVRPVGELVENQYRIGLVRMERAIKERMSLQEVSTLMPMTSSIPNPWPRC
jgi:DNA-directed RNA polymerase subunit beta